MSKRWTIKDVEQVQQEKGKITSNADELICLKNSVVNKNATNKKVKLPQPSANALTAHALRILDLKGFHVWRQNNGGVYDPVKKVFRAGSSTPGISDILGFHRLTGVIIACEIKAGKDRLSEEQETFLANVKRAGGIAIVIRTTDDIENLNKLL